MQTAGNMTPKNCVATDHCCRVQTYHKNNQRSGLIGLINEKHKLRVVVFVLHNIYAATTEMLS